MILTIIIVIIITVILLSELCSQTAWSDVFFISMHPVIL